MVLCHLLSKDSMQPGIPPELIIDGQDGVKRGKAISAPWPGPLPGMIAAAARHASAPGSVYRVCTYLQAASCGFLQCHGKAWIREGGGVLSMNIKPSPNPAGLPHAHLPAPMTSRSMHQHGVPSVTHRASRAKSQYSTLAGQTSLLWLLGFGEAS